MTDGTGTSSYTYDPFNELTATKTAPATPSATATTPTATRPASPTRSAPAPPGQTTDTVSYGYDNADELNSVTDFNGNTISITNTADGLPSAETLGSTRRHDRHQLRPNRHPVRHQTRQRHHDAPGVQLQRRTLRRDRLRNRHAIRRYEPADYSYDAQSRVTQMTPGTDSALNYGFDASGNLTTLPTGASGSLRRRLRTHRLDPRRHHHRLHLQRRRRTHRRKRRRRPP